MSDAHEVWTLVLAKVAQLGEIQTSWTLDQVFDACDALSHYNDVATYLRPRPKAQPRRRQDDAWARADQLATLAAKR